MTAHVIAGAACILLIIVGCNGCRDTRLGTFLAALGSLGIVAVVLL